MAQDQSKMAIIYGGCLGESFWRVISKRRLEGFGGTTCEETRGWVGREGDTRGLGPKVKRGNHIFTHYTH